MINTVLYYCLSIILSAVVSLTLYYYYKYFSTYIYLKNVPKIPQLPIIGAVHLIPNTEALYQKALEFPNKYGRTFWIMAGPLPLLFTSDPNLLEIILSSSKHINKPNIYKIVKYAVGGSGLITANDGIWRSQRKMVTPTFHFKILEEFMKIFNKHANDLVKDLEKETVNASTDAREYTPSWALNQVTETVMGLQAIDNKKDSAMYLKNAKELLNIAMERVINPFEYIDLTFSLTRNYRKGQKFKKQMGDYVRGVIQRKEREFTLKQLSENGNERAKQRTVFLDLLIEHSRFENKLSESDLSCQTATMLFAGFDTTSGAVAYALYNLAENPDVQEQAYQEIRDVLCNDITQDITISHLQDMKYLEIVIKENLRIFSIVPLIARELREDVQWGEVTVPKGMSVVLSLSALHRDPELYPEPEKFIPERFSAENNRTRHAYSYIPFSAGSRNCIGQKYGMLVQKIALAKLVFAYEFLSVGHKPILAAEIALFPKNGIRVAIRKRKH